METINYNHFIEYNRFRKSLKAKSGNTLISEFNKEYDINIVVDEQDINYYIAYHNRYTCDYCLNSQIYRFHDNVLVSANSFYSAVISNKRTILIEVSYNNIIGYYIYDKCNEETKYNKTETLAANNKYYYYINVKYVCSAEAYQNDPLADLQYNIVNSKLLITQSFCPYKFKVDVISFDHTMMKYYDCKDILDIVNSIFKMEEICYDNLKKDNDKAYYTLFNSKQFIRLLFDELNYKTIINTTEPFLYYHITSYGVLTKAAIDRMVKYDDIFKRKDIDKEYKFLDKYKHGYINNLINKCYKIYLILHEYYNN